MLTIVTVNYNNHQGLKRTLESLQSQSFFTHVKHIIVDGKSTDNSHNLIQQFVSKFENSSWIQRTDSSLYEGMNFGILGTTSPFISFLNSGDVLSHPKTLEEISSCIVKFDPDILYGDLEILNFDGSVRRLWISKAFKRYRLYYGWMCPHPMTTFKLSLISQIGKYDLKLKISADYDFMLRVLMQRDCSICYLNEVLVKMEPGGLSNSSLYQIFKANLEVLSAWKKIEGFTPYWIFVLKPFTKLLQLKLLRSFF